MPLKVGKSAKAGVTLITFVALYPFMDCLHMDLQMTGLQKCCLTLRALVIPSLLMNTPDVLVQTGTCMKRSITLVTLKAFLIISVHSGNVISDLSLTPCSPVADVALMLSNRRMCCLYVPQDHFV